MNPLKLIQLLGPILRNLSRTDQKQLLKALSQEGRGMSTAWKMKHAGKRDHTVMHPMTRDADLEIDEILDMLEETRSWPFPAGLGPVGSHMGPKVGNPPLRLSTRSTIDMARPKMKDVMDKRKIYRKR